MWRKCLLCRQPYTNLRFSSNASPETLRCKLLIVGGGTGGCSMAWRFARKLKKGDIILLEPCDLHFNQPVFTLVGAGIKKFKDTYRPVTSVIPKNVTLVKDAAVQFDPDHNAVHTCCCKTICYDYMIVAVGVVNNYSQIPGLQEALDNPHSGVSTIYSPNYCGKTWCQLQNLKGGLALFTFPRGGVKCAGAAQKIMYLADDYFRKKNIRNNINIAYVTGGEHIFGVSKYAERLKKVAEQRQIPVNCESELVEVRGRQAIVTCGPNCETMSLPFNMLHVTPPMCPPDALMRSPLVNETGYLEVDKFTMQHTRYCNVYGVGDCTCVPNSKTSASISKQSYVIEQNLKQTMEGKKPTHAYDGYSACPILTSYKKAILAEFGYDKKLMETFPFDQSKESRLLYRLKTNLLPYIYWNRLIKGKFNGPDKFRKLVNPFGK